jgi:hypothetical protein
LLAPQLVDYLVPFDELLEFAVLFVTFVPFGGFVRSATFKDASFADTTTVSGTFGTAFPPAC